MAFLPEGKFIDESDVCDMGPVRGGRPDVEIQIKGIPDRPTLEILRPGIVSNHQESFGKPPAGARLEGIIVFDLAVADFGDTRIAEIGLKSIAIRRKVIETVVVRQRSDGLAIEQIPRLLTHILHIEKHVGRQCPLYAETELI